MRRFHTVSAHGAVSSLEIIFRLEALPESREEILVVRGIGDGGSGFGVLLGHVLFPKSDDARNLRRKVGTGEKRRLGKSGRADGIEGKMKDD